MIGSSNYTVIGNGFPPSRGKCVMRKLIDDGMPPVLLRKLLRSREGTGMAFVGPLQIQHDGNAFRCWSHCYYFLVGERKFERPDHRTDRARLLNGALPFLEEF